MQGNLFLLTVRQAFPCEISELRFEVQESLSACSVCNVLESSFEPLSMIVSRCVVLSRSIGLHWSIFEMDLCDKS